MRKKRNTSCSIVLKNPQKSYGCKKNKQKIQKTTLQKMRKREQKQKTYTENKANVKIRGKAGGKSGE